MADIQQELLRLFQQQQQPVTPQLNTGLLAPDQGGLSDVFTNPDQAQVNALVGGLAGLANPRGRDPALMAVAQGAQAFQNTRMQDYQRRVQGEKLRQENLKNQLQGALGIANFGTSQQDLQRKQQEFTQTQGLAERKFTASQQETDKTGSIQLPDGSTRRAFLRNGRLHTFNDEGSAVDISGQGAKFSPDTTQSINVNTGEGSFSKEIGKKLAGNVVERFDAAQSAADSLRNDFQAEKLLDEGIVSGFGADVITGFGNALVQMGFSEFEEPVANTQAYIATRAQEVGQIITLFGAGTGLSDKDREFAEKAAAGNINVTEAALRKIIRINKHVKTNVVKAFNKRLSKLPEGSVPFDMTVSLPERTTSKQDTIKNIRSMLSN